MYVIYNVDILTVLSNLFLLIPFGGAIYYRRWTRAFVYFWMLWVSFFYHLCTAFVICIFSYSHHQALDFFFAQLLIILTGLYLIDFPRDLPWLERGLIFLGGIAIFALQMLFGIQFYVQAAIAGVVAAGVGIYWLTCGVPDYDWSMLLLGLALIIGSVQLYTAQNLQPKSYWGVHSLWHTAAAMGQFYWLQIKPRAPKYAALDSKIK
jgi:hypothetical protein